MKKGIISLIFILMMMPASAMATGITPENNGSLLYQPRDISDNVDGLDAGFNAKRESDGLNDIVPREAGSNPMFDPSPQTDQAAAFPVPEPATMLLLGMGLLGIGAIGRKLPL